jgi:multiple sugar transport system substrate-binding protein
MDVIKGRNTRSVPDVFQIGTTWITTLSYLGALEQVPENPFGPREHRIASSIGDSSPFCIPWFIDIRVLYYRKDIFEAFHIDPKLLEDWKGFTKACAELKRNLEKSERFPRIVAPLGIPGQKPGVLMHDLAPWVWEAGGDFCSDDLRETNLNQVPLMQGCEFYFDLIDQGYMPVANSALPQGNYFTGHYAMQFSGSWPVDTYLNPAWEYAMPDVAVNTGVAPLPSGPQGRYTFLGGSNLGVSSMSQNKDYAWEFIHFMMDPARISKHARAIGSLPARLAGMEELFERIPAAKEVFFSSFGYARRLPRLVELGSVEQIVYKMSARILSLIRERTYNHKRLHQEIQSANNEIKTLLSVHRYGTHIAQVAA